MQGSVNVFNRMIINKLQCFQFNKTLGLHTYSVVLISILSVSIYSTAFIKYFC